MAHSENNTLSSAFKTFFERETLTGPNFNDWYRSLRIVLRVADTFDYLYKPCPGQPADTATEAEKAAFKAEYKKHSDVACIMLGKMSPALQRQFENYPPQNMLAELRKMFEKPPAVEIYDLVDALHSCRQAPGKPVSEHVLEMKGLMDQLHTLGKPYDNDMAVNLINRSLNKDFGDFVRNFNMHCVGKTVTELHALLIDFEKGLKDKAPTPQVFTIQKGRDNKPKPQANKKVKGKGKADKNKQVVPYQPKPKPNPLKRKENPNKDQACHHCHVAGHWKRNCPLYIEELRANKKKSEPGAAVSGNLFAIELFNLTYKLNSWVYDTGCGIHVCNTLQGFKEERKLSYGDQYLQVGNGTQAAVEAIGMFDLVLPSGLVLKLNNCYYAPSIVRDGMCLFRTNDYDLMDANKKFDLDHVQCLPEEDGSKYRLRFMLDKKELSLTLDDFRTILHLPQENNNNHNSFVPPPSFSDMVPFYKQQLGFTMELKTSSSFKTTGLLQPWQTLCKIFSKCLTTHATGWDQPSLQIMQMMHCFVNNIYVDYAELLWEGI
ncbi:zinc finger, CCHC-type containing protein, partial [Tanacetum coccineum]